MKPISFHRQNPFRFALGIFLTLQLLATFADLYAEPVLQVGWFAANCGKSHHVDVDIDGAIGDDFGVGHSTPQNVLVGVGYYFDGFKTDRMTLSYGLNAFYLAPIKVKGSVTQEDIFTNLSYSYALTNYPIYLAAKASFHCSSQWDITLDLGLGPNLIRSGSFREKSLDDGVSIPDTHAFVGKTVATFSVNAGVGVRLNDIFKSVSLEIDYRFFYLGQGKLKKNNNQLINSLHSGNDYANALFLSISI